MDAVDQRDTAEEAAVERDYRAEYGPELECERAWPSLQPTRGGDSYRQHRCGFAPAGHLGDCVCRYCGTRRWIGGEG